MEIHFHLCKNCILINEPWDNFISKFSRPPYFRHRHQDRLHHTTSFVARENIKMLHCFLNNFSISQLSCNNPHAGHFTDSERIYLHVITVRFKKKTTKKNKTVCITSLQFKREPKNLCFVPSTNTLLNDFFFCKHFNVFSPQSLERGPFMPRI